MAQAPWLPCDGANGRSIGRLPADDTITAKSAAIPIYTN